MGDLTDPFVCQQLAKKHPKRRDEDELPLRLSDLAGGQGFERLEVKLGETMRTLRRLRGTGVTGFRNEYLKALSEKFEDERAAKAVKLIEEFGGFFLNAELPAWFYAAYSASEQCAPIKKLSSKADPSKPDCRPLSKSECLPRMLNSKLVADVKGDAQDELWPHNVGSATDGCSVLALGVRLASEVRPRFVVVNIDVYNAHNEIKRKVVLEKLSKSRRLRKLVPAYWAQYGPKSRVYFRGRRREVIRADYDSEEALRQGCPLAQLGFNNAIHDDVKWLDGELAKHGGFARFLHDDGYAVGEPDVVFELVAEFERRIAPLGLRLQLDKCACYSAETELEEHPARPEGKFPVSCALRRDDGGEAIGTTADCGNADHPYFRAQVIGHGCVVAGVPIGDAEFVRVHLEGTVTAALSKCSNISTMLRDDCTHSLHTLNIRCLQPILCYWTQHVYPSDMLRAEVGAPSEAARMDAGLLEVAAQTQGAFLRRDEIAQRRLRLPSRNRGGALRSHEKTANAAFACTLAKVAPRLVRSTDEEGNVRTGFLEQLAGEVFGDGHFNADEVFDWGGDGRFAEFLAPPGRLGIAGLDDDEDAVPALKTRLATEFRDAWSSLRDEVGRPTQGALGAPPESAGLMFQEGNAAQSIAKPLRQVTIEREKSEFDKLDATIRRLPSDDMRRTAWLNVDKTATVWLNALPNSSDRLNNNEFAEVSARYYGMPSPACAPFVGLTVGGRTLDAYGFAIASESMMGDGWRRQHDTLKWRMWEDAREMGQHANTEVYGLFAAHIPQAGRQRLTALPVCHRANDTGSCRTS